MGEVLRGNASTNRGCEHGRCGVVIRRSAFAGSADPGLSAAGRRLSHRQLAALAVACAVVFAVALSAGGLLPLPSLLEGGWQLLAPSGTPRNSLTPTVVVRTSGGGPGANLLGSLARVATGGRGPHSATGSSPHGHSAVPPAGRIPGDGASGSSGGAGSSDPPSPSTSGSGATGTPPTVSAGASGGSVGVGASTGSGTPVGAGVSASGSTSGASGTVTVGGSSVGVTVPVTGPPAVSVGGSTVVVPLPTP